MTENIGNILSFFERSITKTLTNKDGENKTITLTFDDLIGVNTESYLNTYLLYIAHKQKLDVDNLSVLTKIKELLKESKIKCIIDKPNDLINIQLNTSIFTFDSSNIDVNLMNKLTKDSKYLTALDFSYDDELNNNKQFIINQINDKISSLKTKEKEQIEKFYLASLTLTLTKYLK